MKILELDNKTEVSEISLGLTKREATELRDSLEALLNSEPGRHEHVSNDDFKTEITIYLTE